jgi:thiamine biosynthesis lipoprotein
MERRSFRAMGTEIELLVDCDRASTALDAAEAEFHRLEALLSRFRPDSELSRLNEAGELRVGPDLRRVLELALEARERTGGRFDPTLHDELVAAGYDRSFELVAAGEVAGSPPAARRASAAGSVTLGDDAVRLEGVRIDLGGIAKGYAAERAAEVLATAGPCLVNAGGDVATRGGSWPVGVETADGIVTVVLSHHRGLATSGRDRRRWRRSGRELHHLIDPSTGEPGVSDILRVTVVAADAIEAEVAAKALFLAGFDRAAQEADAEGIPTVLVGEDGRTDLAGGLA